MSISNHDDVIDSRDVIDRIEKLEAERAELVDLLEEARDSAEEEESQDALRNWDEDYSHELKTLKELAEDGESASADWRHGEALINESHWEEYCREMCKDIGDLPAELPWYIEDAIDWEKVASNIAADYSTVDFDGVEYYIRCC